MKVILFKLVFFFSTFLVAQTIEGSYDNKEIFEEVIINGLSIKPGKYISEEELKAVIEINEDRSEWGKGLDWNNVKISFEEEDDYHGDSSTFYTIDFSKNSGLAITVVGKENDFGFVPGFSLQSPDIIVGFLNHKFKIGDTKKEDVEGLFYNGKIEKVYPSGSIRYTAYTHGGKLHFVFNKDGVLKSIRLESF